MTKAIFPSGVYAASLTWFSGDSQEIDYELQSKHLTHLISSGLTGVVIAGSNGEAVALSAEERLKLITLTKETATRCGRQDMPIIIGTVGQSTKDIISQLHASKAAGAGFGLVLTPSYFHFAMDAAAIQDFYTQVADESPIPILIYSWPLVTSGIDITSDIMSVLGRHSNIVGTKLTCGGIGKAVRIAAEFKQEEFCALTGFSDWLVAALSIGAAGTISGFANLCPRACLKIYKDYQDGKIEEARALQFTLAQAEWHLTQVGINGTKWTVAKLLGYGLDVCATRKPYPAFANNAAQEAVLAAMAPIWAQEEALK